MRFSTDLDSIAAKVESSDIHAQFEEFTFGARLLQSSEEDSPSSTSPSSVGHASGRRPSLVSLSPTTSISEARSKGLFETLAGEVVTSDAEKTLLELVANLKLLVSISPRPSLSNTSSPHSTAPPDEEDEHAIEMAARERSSLEDQVLENVDDLSTRVAGFREALLSTNYGPLSMWALGYRVEHLYEKGSDWPARLAEDLTRLWRSSRKGGGDSRGRTSSSSSRSTATTVQDDWSSPVEMFGGRSFFRQSPRRSSRSTHRKTVSTSDCSTARFSPRGGTVTSGGDGAMSDPTSSVKARRVVQILLGGEVNVRRDPLLGLLKGSLVSESQ